MGWVWWLAVELPLAGRLASWLVPGRRPLTWSTTTLCALVGSLLAGAAGYVWLDKDLAEGALQRAGFLGTAVGAVVVVAALRLWPAASTRTLPRAR